MRILFPGVSSFIVPLSFQLVNYSCSMVLATGTLSSFISAVWYWSSNTSRKIYLWQAFVFQLNLYYSSWILILPYLRPLLWTGNHCLYSVPSQSARHSSQFNLREQRSNSQKILYLVFLRWTYNASWPAQNLVERMFSAPSELFRLYYGYPTPK